MSTLYLMLGYPGAGKTTTAKMIHKLSGAVHLWADQERHKRFQKPTYSQAENDQLYDQMNQEAGELLAAGKSVIFDTNFNYYADRQHLRQIAQTAGATTQLIWVTVPPELAHERATADIHKQDNGFSVNMSDDHFNRLTSSLEPPQNGETYIEIDGTQVTPAYVASKLGINS